jgi:hypothetical protein
VLTVRYAGDGGYRPSSATGAFTVAKEDTDLALSLSGKGKQRRLIARLSDRDAPAQGIAERTIDFYADGRLLGSAVTDQDGIAALANPPKGKHVFEARFAGDDYYLGSSA